MKLISLVREWGAVIFSGIIILLGLGFLFVVAKTLFFGTVFWIIVAYVVTYWDMRRAWEISPLVTEAIQATRVWLGQQKTKLRGRL